ncbi:MAG TPA: cupin domain-containing protein [Pyrinomonadaceae bacterium]|nr:cupin domain-containing protein [Pyrinomonadaceae bacterium]
MASIVSLLIFASCAVNRENDNSQVSSNRPPETAPQNNPGVKCAENSPERRGEEGCTILANRPLAGSVEKPVYWHIDGFDSLEAANKAAGPDGVAVEAHGAIWLMTIEAPNEDHHGGRHIAAIGPLVLPPADRYMMRVQSTFLKPGSTTPVHTHSGPEGIYVVDGEQCMETLETGHRIAANQSLIVKSGEIHRGRVIGNVGRRGFGMIVYDAAKPPSHDLAEPPPLVSCQ